MKAGQLLFVFITFITFSLHAYGPERNFGVGIMIGEPTGISAKYWLSNNEAVDGGLGYSFVGSYSYFSLHADYLYHIDDLIQSSEKIPFYYGFGIRLRTSNKENGLGVRGVSGLIYNLHEVPVELFFEIVPVFQLFPETALNLDVALGGRYYFN